MALYRATTRRLCEYNQVISLKIIQFDFSALDVPREMVVNGGVVFESYLPIFCGKPLCGIPLTILEIVNPIGCLQSRQVQRLLDHLSRSFSQNPEFSCIMCLAFRATNLIPSRFAIKRVIISPAENTF